MRPFNLIISVLSFISLVSCAPTVKESLEMPKWVYHYDSGHQICGVGTSLPHIRGIAYQRALGISRAIDEIARQMNVAVETKLESYMSGTDSGSSSSLTTYSVQTTSGQSVSAQVEDAWLSDGGEFYVLMCTR